MNTWLLTIILSLVTCLCGIPESNAASKHALLIGVSDYEGAQGFGSLRGPINDIHLIKKVLIDRFDFKEEDIIILPNGSATHTGLQAAFGSLAGRVGPGDFVYIHYSGHGSFRKDSHGDEKDGIDVTWVSYGSRHRRLPEDNLDRHDILDDEINEWLAPLSRKTDQVVFVSDSCHSATMTRGVVTRGIEEDPAPHPLAAREFQPVEFPAWVQIGAAQDTEAAGEDSAEDGKVYGVFTRYWARALLEAQPDETWEEVFKRTAAQVVNIKGSQHPDIQGSNKQCRVFGGKFAPPSRAIPIQDVMDRGKTAIISAGLLAGITPGSVYRGKVTAPGHEPALVVITDVEATSSKGKVTRGDFEPGDLIVEESHAYSFDPIPVYIAADLQDDVDRNVRKAMSDALLQLPAFKVTEDQKEAKLILYILHPRREERKTGQEVRKQVYALPESFASEPPEVWVLSAEGRLLGDGLRIDFTSVEDGGELLKRSLGTWLRIQEIKALALSSDAFFPLEVEVVRLTPDDTCTRNDPACRMVKKFNRYYRVRSFPVSQLKGQQLTKDEILTFRIENKSEKTLYCYIIDIGTRTGVVKGVFPRSSEASQSGSIKPGEVLDLFARGSHALHLSDPDEELIQFIVADTPMDVGLLETEGYRRGEEMGSRGPQMKRLERVLTSAIHGVRTRGGEAISLSGEEWGSVLFDFSVVEGAS